MSTIENCAGMVTDFVGCAFDPCHNSTRPGVWAFLALLLLLGCVSPDAPPQPAWRTAGDTLIVTSPPPSDTTRLRDVEILTRSDELDRPGAMAVAGRHLAVVDRRRFHLVDLHDGSLRSIGGEGEGPGEFRSVSAIGTAADSILVYDSRLRRFSVWDLDGNFKRSQYAPPLLPYVSQVRLKFHVTPASFVLRDKHLA